MPALQRIRKQAETVACLVLLKQWSPLFIMYVDESNGYLIEGFTGANLRNVSVVVIGLAVGLYLGHLLLAIIDNWAGTAISAKWTMAVLGFLFGSAGGAGVFRLYYGIDYAFSYLLGLAGGMIAVFFCRRVPSYFSRPIAAVVPTISVFSDNKSAVTTPDETPSWPPENGQEFVQSEKFGNIVLDIVTQLTIKVPSMDFTWAPAHAFIWFDRKLREDYLFINKKRFSTINDFKAYVRQILWNNARLVERNDNARGRRTLKIVEQRATAQIRPDVITPDEYAVMVESLIKLPEQHRTILIKILFRKEDPDNLATELGMTKKQIFRIYTEAIDMLK
jgi:hypothetical protein